MKKPTFNFRLLTMSIFILISLASTNMYAQRPTDGKPYKDSIRFSFPGHLTPGGYFDTVFDRFGHKLLLGQIAVNDTIRRLFDCGTSHSSHSTSASTHLYTGSTCASNYFNIYLEDGCGMELYATNPTEAARLNVLNQVLCDLSALINSPCSVTHQKVNIWVRAGVTTGLGAATPFFILPYSTTKSGIVDNTEWLTINSGRDAFTNFAPPLTTSGGGTIGSGPSTVFFHGAIYLNFSVGSGFTWHTDLHTVPGPGEVDLYTTILHEMMHTLGFCTLIDYNGRSIFDEYNVPPAPATYQYYSRYDLHLKYNTGTSFQPLITGSATGCDLYQYGFNTYFSTPASVLSPSSPSCSSPPLGTETDYTYCSTAVDYVGGWGTVPVYTPPCFEPGASLSHFEDECYIPAGYPITAVGAANNEYFVMSNEAPSLSLGVYSPTNPGTTKRYPTPEERQTLCDIGYSVNTNYGVTTTPSISSTYTSLTGTNLNYYIYGGTMCPGNQVVGFNDGITGGGYIFYATPGVGTDINAGASGGSILDNDLQAGVSMSTIPGTSFKCLEVMTGSGAVSSSVGTYSTTVTYTPGGGDYGVQLLRYIPVSSSGAEGNITYIYVLVGTAGCTPSGCNLVTNGDFENVSPGGTTWPSVHCWSIYQTPDLTPTYGTNIPPDPTIVSDVYFTAFEEIQYMPGNFYTEAITEYLAAPLTPGSNYTISFWYKGQNLAASTPSTYFTFAGSSSPIYISASIPGAPSGYTSLKDINLSMDNTWHPITVSATYTSSVVANYITIYPSPWLNPSTYPSNYSDYTFIDNIQIVPSASVCTFTLNPTMCANDPPINLASITTCGTGTFTWETITSAGTPTITISPIFDPESAYQASMDLGHNGLVYVRFDYTDPTGCSSYTIAETKIGPPINGNTTVCVGSTTGLSAPAGGTWSSSNTTIATVNTFGVVRGISPGTANISYTLPGGCSAARTITVISLLPPITGIPYLCVGSNTTLNDAVSGGAWSSSNPTIASINPTTGYITGYSAGTVIITYALSGCSVTAVVTVNSTLPSGITGTTSAVCAGPVLLSDATTGGIWSSNNTNIAIIGSGTGVVSGVNPGVAIISYTVGGCSTTASVTINTPPAITGLTVVCPGTTISLSDATAGGTWSSSNTTIATVSGTGVVSGITSGVVTITYTISTGCISTETITVNTPPAIGGPSSVCVPYSITLNDAALGGVWSSSNTLLATVGSTGIVTGVSAGNVTITYTTTTGCMTTKIVTVNSVPPIGGTTTAVCTGPVTLSDATTGGIWSSNNTNIAIIGSGTGVVTGVSPGAVIITYSLGSCIAVSIETVNMPAAIKGASSVCVGSTTSLSDATAGGTWSSSNTTIATVSGTGVVSGITSGTTIITYTLGTGCFTTATITAMFLSSPITGPSGVCIGSTINLSDATTGGVWSSSNISRATVTTTGIVTGVAAGTVMVTYSYSGCFATHSMTVNPSPAAITGPTSICQGYTTNLSDATHSGTWTSSNTTIATVGLTSGTVKGISAGTATITYTLPGGCFITTTITTVTTGTATCTPCSEFGGAYTALGTSAGGIITTSIGAGNYYIGNDVYISGSQTFTDAVILMAAGVHIYIEPTASLTLNGCHLFSCPGSMWDGIVLQTSGSNTGILILQGDANGRSALIEDAITGVSVTNPAHPNSGAANFIASFNTVFNGCNTGISISSYSPATSVSGTNTYEFHIENTVFTSRDFHNYVLTGVHYPFQWPSTTGTYGLKTSWTPPSEYVAPYNLASPNAGGTGISYPFRACHNSVSTTTGIALNGVGANTYPTYSSAVIGTPNTAIVHGQNTQLNLFESINTGISATNANLSVYNCSFSNITPVTVFPVIGIGGNAIYTAMNDGNKYQLTVDEGVAVHFGGLTTYSPNSFYGCIKGVNSSNYYHINCNNSLMMTSQVSTAAMLSYMTAWGYDIQSSAYDAVTMSNNTIYNTANAISFVSTLGAGYWVYHGGLGYYVSGTQYDGNITIDNNTILASANPYTTSTTDFCSFGIAVQNVVNNTSGSILAGLSITPAGTVETDANTITDAYRGILVQSYWMQQAFSRNNNIVVMSPAAANTSVFTYGINHTDCTNDYITHNTVSGEPVLPKLIDSMRAYYMAFNTDASIFCNTAQNTGRGFEFFEKNPGTDWEYNSMQNHLKGMVLNGGLIGQQGSYHYPHDNAWLIPAGWNSGTHVQTAVLGGANAINSVMYVKTNTATIDYDPIFNTGFFTDIYSASLGSLQPAGLDFALSPCYAIHSATLTPQLPAHEQISQKRILYQTDSATNDWLGQYTTWQTLKNDAALTSSSSILSTFNTLAANSRFNYLTKLEKCLAMGNADSATSQLSITPPPLVGSGTYTDSATGVKVADDYNSDFIVNNYKSFYSVYLNYSQFAMTGADSSNLIYMAGLCPSRYGAAVYRARSLYTVVFNELRVWNDDSCAAADTGSHSSGARHSTSDTSTDAAGNGMVLGSVQRYYLYPNPNNGNINISQMVPDIEPVMIEVFDLVGRSVYRNSVRFEEANYMLNLTNIAEGMYLAQITDSKGRKFIYKFVKGDPIH